jgi:hypothetical protein
MTTGGWIMIVFSWVLIISLTGFCYWRIFGAKHPHIQAPLEIDTETD